MDKGSDHIMQIDVILITGFLGSGKTTVLNKLTAYLKSQGHNTAVIINEFGKVSIDRLLIENDQEAIYEVNQGSIFCTCTANQLISAVSKVLNANPRYDMLIIEATGLALTGDIGRYISEAGFSDSLKIISNVCVADALNFHKVYETLPAVTSQIKAATICVINKTDLASKEKIDMTKDKIKKLNPTAKIIETQYGELDFSVIISFDDIWKSDLKLHEEAPFGIKAVTLAGTFPISIEKLKSWINENISNILRAKGYLNTGKEWLYVEVIGQVILIKPFLKNPGTSGRLVIIYRDIDEEKLRNDFKNTGGIEN